MQTVWSVLRVTDAATMELFQEGKKEEITAESQLQWGTSRWSEWPSLKNLQTNAGEGGEKRQSSDIGGNVNWCSHHGNQYRGPSKNWTQSYHMNQQSHSWAYIQTKLIQKDTRTPKSPQHYPQQPHSNQDTETTQMFINKEMDKDVVPTVKYYSAIKRNGTMPAAATWTQLKMVILS